MYQEKRPTSITVMGWAWIVIGSLMFLSGIMSLLAAVMMGQMSQPGPDASQDMPGIFRFMPLMAVVQVAVAVLGLVSGINFLKLKAWSRNVLEILTWILLVYCIGFGIYWVYNWISMTSAHGPQGFGTYGAVMGVVIFGIFSVPLGIMLKHLRGQKVRNAMIVSAD